MITKYYCEQCGKEFDNATQCEKHENICKHRMSEEKAETVSKVGWSNMCEHCGNAYYVYGCERDCSYARSCRGRDKYPFWKPVENKE